MIQLGLLQSILNGVGVPTTEADLLYLRTAGLTRNPEDIHLLTNVKAMGEMAYLPPGHAKKRADCVDLVEFLGSTKPPVTEVDRYDSALKIQQIWRAHIRAKL